MDIVEVFQKAQEIQLGGVMLITCTSSCRYKESIKK